MDSSNTNLGGDDTGLGHEGVRKRGLACGESGVRVTVVRKEVVMTER